MTTPNQNKCPKCGGSIRCLGGKPAHDSNWYCEDETGCGWQAWDSEDTNKSTNLDTLRTYVKAAGGTWEMLMLEPDDIEPSLCVKLNGYLYTVHPDNIGVYEHWLSSLRSVLFGEVMKKVLRCDLITLHKNGISVCAPRFNFFFEDYLTIEEALMAALAKLVEVGGEL